MSKPKKYNVNPIAILVIVILVADLIYLFTGGH